MAVDIMAEVKTALIISGTDDDALLTQLQVAAQAFIEQFCGRSFTGGTHVELHYGGLQLVFLRNYPVNAVVSLKVDATSEFPADSLRSASSYVVHGERGVVENRDGPFVPALPGWVLGPTHFPQAVRVEYTTVTEAVPAPILRAQYELIGHWYRQAKTMASTSHINLLERPDPDGQLVYPWNQSVGFKLPEGVLQLLRAYRVPAQ